MKRTLIVLLGYSLAFAALAETDSAAGGKSPEALQILEKVDAATKAVTAVRYKATSKPSGAAESFFSPAEGTVVLVGWNGSRPQKFMAHVKTKRQGSDESIELTGGGDGDSYFLVDHAAKKAYEDMDPGVLGSSRRPLQAVNMVEFVHPAPFDDELNADTVELLEPETVAGEECHRIRVVYSGGQGESVWSFSQKDYLPRRRVQRFSSPQGDGEIDNVITALEVDPRVDVATFRLKLPEGYEQIDDFAP